MDKLPAEWRHLPLERIVAHNEGLRRGPFGGALKKAFFVDYGYKVYEQKHAIYKNFTIGSYYIDESKFREMKQFQVHHGDFIVSCSGTIGKIARVPEGAEHGVINQALLRIRVEPEIVDPDFFLYQFESDKMQDTIVDNTHGGAMANLVGMDIFRKVKFVVPPLAEQRKIAAIIGTWDAAIAMAEKLIAALRERKKGLMQRLLTGRVRFRGFEGEWKTGNLGDLLEKIIGGGTPSRDNPAYWTNNGIPWITVKDLSSDVIEGAEEHITDLGLQESASNLISSGTVIMATRMAVGKTIRSKVTAAINQDLKALIPKQALRSDFLHYCLLHLQPTIERIGIGSTVKGIQLIDLRRFKIPVLSLKEQYHIVALLEACDQEIMLLERKHGLLKQQKRGLMQRLLTGQVRVQVDED